MAQKKSKHAPAKKAQASHEGVHHSHKPAGSAQAANLFNYKNNPFNNMNPFNGMISQGAKAMQDKFGGFAGGAGSAKKVQEKVLEFSREGAENLARSADSAAKKLNDAISLSKENFEALVESANIASKVAKNIGAEISEYTNNLVTENFKAFEEFLSCKTVSDFLSLNSSLIKNNVDSAFNESLKLTELFMEMGKATQPLTEQASAAAEKLTKNMAA